MTDSDFWSWFAGFWEGEGSIGIYPNKLDNGNHVIFQVSQSDAKPLKYIMTQLQEFKGLKVAIREYPSSEFIAPNTKQPYRRNPHFLLTIQRKVPVLHILKSFYPYLRFRNKQVQDAILKLENLITTSRQRVWEQSEIEYLKNHYGEMSTKLIAHDLKRSLKSVYGKTFELNHPVISESRRSRSKP